VQLRWSDVHACIDWALEHVSVLSVGPGGFQPLYVDLKRQVCSSQPS
jgi:hypothetical protein